MTIKPDFNDVLQKALSEFDGRKQAEKERLENALTLWDAVQEPGDMPISEALFKVIRRELMEKARERDWEDKET